MKKAKTNWLDLCLELVSDYLDQIYDDEAMEQKFPPITESAFSIAEYASHSPFITDKIRVASMLSSGLGLLLQETYQYSLALEAYKKALSIKAKHGNPNRFAEHFNIAKMLNETEDFEGAIKYYTLCIRERQKRGGKHHISLIDYYLEIASCYSQQDDNFKAVQNCLICLDILSKNKDADDPYFVYVFEIYTTLSEIYLQCGDYRESAKYSIGALRICRSHFEKNEFYYLSKGRLFHVNARIYLCTGDYRKSLTWLNKELAIYSALDEDMEGIASKISQTYNRMGIAKLRQRHFEEAIKCYQTVLRYQKELHITASPEAALTMNNLGFVYGEMEEWEKAFEYYDEALKILLRYFGEYHSDTMLVYYNMAHDYCTMKDYPKSLALTEKIIGYYSNIHGGCTTHLADAYLCKGRTLHCQSQFDEAVVYYRRALDIQRQLYFDFHPDIGETHKCIADALFDSGSDLAMALDSYNHAKEIFEKALSKDNNRLSLIYKRIKLLSDHQ